MKIGIDISQLAYENTGVSNYLKNLLENLGKIDQKNDYILFFSSMRNSPPNLHLPQNFELKVFKIPPTVLDFIWNKLHILPIEWLIGKFDIFITSDWTEPPSRLKKATILYDLIVYKYPEETHSKTEFNPFKFLISPNIVASQKRKLKWVKKESSLVICISKATANDAKEILKIDEEKMKVIYSGF
ncbi:MAG: hypothetical protein HYT09_00020 [Candidatus Levybacteria bacterium]|nr:hypothetical protein [Candidatus Levybacteria bacterium]